MVVLERAMSLNMPSSLLVTDSHTLYSEDEQEVRGIEEGISD